MASTRIFVNDGSALGDASAVAEAFATCDQYMLQGEAFSKVVRGEMPLPYGVADAIQNVQVIDALFLSAKRGAGELVSTG